jgi:hypothetical protein
VLNTTTKDDIKYKGVEINTKVMKRKGGLVQQWDMEGLDNYGANQLFNNTLAGDFTNLDRS